MNRTVGVLALQGAFRAHADVLDRLDRRAVAVRTVEQLESVDAVILPGGESSTISMLLDSSGLRGALGERVAEGMPIFGTCAGMILLAAEILDGRPDQMSFGAIDIAVRRNAYGRQVDSFETDLEWRGGVFRAVFIRAPRVEWCGPEVEILAEHEGRPVLLRQGNVLVAAFHPELTADPAIHRYFVETVCSAPPDGATRRNDTELQQVTGGA